MMIHDFGDDSNPHCTLGRNGLLVTQGRPAKSEQVEYENEGKYQIFKLPTAKLNILSLGL